MPKIVLTKKSDVNAAAARAQNTQNTLADLEDEVGGEFEHDFVPESHPVMAAYRDARAAYLNALEAYYG